MWQPWHFGPTSSGPYLDEFRADMVNNSSLSFQTFITTMKPPSVLHIVFRPIPLLKPYHRPKLFAQMAVRNVRGISTTPHRPFLDGCFVQTHSLISGIHGMTGLPWAATIPLVAFIVRLVIVFPTHVYCVRLSHRLAPGVQNVLALHTKSIYWICHLYARFNTQYDYIYTYRIAYSYI